MSEFDTIAPKYDQEFSNSLIGTLQRNSVHHYLENQFSSRELAAVLDLGCGTGEDAIWMAKKGCNVTATDVSAEMTSVAKKKAASSQVIGSLKFEVLDMHLMDNFKSETKFDLIFSNFGAVNCLNPEAFKALLHSLHGLLASNGRIILVIMPSLCLWESFYFLLKGRWNEMFRRMNKEGIVANLGGSQVKTWYYPPRWIRKQVRQEFTVRKIKPVGFSLPPSYLEHFFTNKQGLLRILAKFEGYLSKFSCLAGISDHYLIELERKA